MEPSTVVILLALFIGVVIGAVFLFRWIAAPKILRSIEKDIKIRYYSAAIDKLKVILKRDEKNYKAHRLLGQALFLSKKYSEAITSYRIALENVQYEPLEYELQVREELADCLNQGGNILEAIEEYLLLTKLDLKNDKYLIVLGKLFLDSNNLEKATEFLTKAAAINKKDVELNFLLGECQFKSGYLTKAQKSFEITLGLQPSNANAHYYLGEIFMEHQNYGGAIDHFKVASKAKDYKLRALKLLGKAYYLSGNLTQTVAVLSSALDENLVEDDHTMTMRYYLGLAFEDQKDYDSALFHWEKVYHRNPNFMDISQKLEAYKDVRSSEALKRFVFAEEDDFKEFCKIVVNKLGFELHDSKGSDHDLFKCIGRESDKSLGTKAKLFFIVITRKGETVVEADLRHTLEEMQEYNCMQSIYLSTSAFDRAAKLFADTRPIKIFSAKEIENYLPK